jgi:hypothetical protein
MGFSTKARKADNFLCSNQFALTGVWQVTDNGGSLSGLKTEASTHRKTFA